MSSERGARIIALALTVFQLHITYGQLYEQVYRFKARCFKMTEIYGMITHYRRLGFLIMHVLKAFKLRPLVHSVSILR